jgi:hypothetical protein
MPSWKKVITSGSNAAFSSLIVSNTITGSISGSLTGSLQGTASWAQNSLTASYVNPLYQNVIITGSVYLATSSIYFSGSSAASRLVWNNTDGTLDLGLKGGNVTLQIGQEEVIRVVNKTGANLLESEYKAIRIRRADEGGAQGQRLAVVLAQANNDPNSVDTLGLVTENIDVNQEGFITTSGLVRGIDTTGTLQGETWADGDVLYLSPTTAGAITKIKPQSPQHSVTIGYVVYAHQNNGIIFVKVDNGYEIDELHNVRITTASLTSGQLLVRSGSNNSGVWINSNQLTGSYGLTGSLSFVNGGVTGSLFGTASWATNALTASFAPNYLLTSSFNTWTGSNSSRFSGTSSYANFTRVLRISGSLPGDVEEGGNVYILPVYRSGNAVFGSTGSIYAVSSISSTGILHYSASLDRILTTASWAVNALTASYAMNAPSALPGGNFGEIQYNNSNTFDGVPALIYTGSTLIGSGSFSGNLRLGLYRGAQTDIIVDSAADEVLIYTHYIPSGTFTDNDVIRVRWRTYNDSKGNPEYYIYMADTSDFSTISGSSANIIAFCTASDAIGYLQMKRDFSLNATNGTLEHITTSIPLITDDISLIATTPIKTFSMDWNTTDYWMFFSAKPNDGNNLCVSKYCTVERI